ncbi:MAG: IPT/TIG domain-containing protein [Labilithrix sp.]|nr:IPT/TIG domain-containing protein [Labilithrix sp.]
MRRRFGLAFGCALACVIVGACLPGAGPALLPPEDGSTSVPDLGDSGFNRSDVDLGDPFALEGLNPSHGPYTGGTSVRLTGRGFTTKLRVFIGGVEVQTLAGDPTRALIVTPPGVPGLADVKIRDDATAQERTLKGGFTYDAIVITPNTGATSGGTLVRIDNGGAGWSALDATGNLDSRGLGVEIGGVKCASVGYGTGQPLDRLRYVECVTPPGSPGAKDVTIKTPGGQTITQARDAFTYSDSPDGYRGGLSGGALAGRLRALAFNAAVGTPIAGATVIVGGSLPTATVQQTAITGVTEFNGLTSSKVTVTIAAKCHQPITYVDVPVDTVTAYLNPVFDPSCADGDPPSTGGRGGRFGGIIEGQLVFPGSAEFKKTGWSTVPAPTRPTERRAAYVFEASPTPSALFQLPPASEAITPDSAGGAGYGYSTVVFPGSATLYVVAGLEDRSEEPPRFVPYAMGIARGVSVPAQTRVTGVDVMMNILFDHQVTIAPQPPTPGPRGPDRLAASVALTLGNAGYAILPRGVMTVPLPAPASIPFTGMPSLDKAIAGEQYVLGGVAATGAQLQRPASVVGRVRTTNANDPVALGGFIAPPTLVEPAGGSWSGTHVQFDVAAPTANLHVIQVSSGYGLVTWTIVAPGGVTSFDVPDLAALPGPDPLGLFPGGIFTTVYVARIDDFTYGKVRSGQLGAGAWNAYAFDSLSGAY